MASRSYRACPELLEAIHFSLMIQVFLLILTGFIADGGNTSQMCVFSTIGFNSYLILALIFRPKSPTRMDLFLIRAGFLPTIEAAYLISDRIWKLRGF